MIKQLAILCTTLIALLVLSPQVILATGATMTFSPNNGEFSDEFFLNLIIDGGENSFNAAEASIQPSTNLFIKDILLGDCNFTFLKPPTSTNLSFEGVILGNSSKNCTVYTLVVVPIEDGEAGVSITDASVKRYGDATDILSEAQNAVFTVTATTTPTQSQNGPQLNQPQEGKYTVVLRMYLDQNTVPQTQVKLTNVDTKETVSATTDASGVVFFENIEGGLYTISANTNETFFEDTIININGENRTVSLGITLKNKPPSVEIKNNFSTLLSNRVFQIIIGGLLLVITALTIVIIKNKKK